MNTLAIELQVCIAAYDHCFPLQNGQTYLTDLERELQQKSQLLERAIALVKSTGATGGPSPGPHRADQV